MKHENEQEQLVPLTCNECGYSCTSSVDKKGGRLLEDDKHDTYINLVSISHCKTRRDIKNGIPGEIAREGLNKGEKITESTPKISFFN
jgi:hypothetical protein